METSDNPVDRMLTRVEYDRGDGAALEKCLGELRAIRHHAPDPHILEGFSALVHQGARLTPQQLVSLRGAMDAVLRCAQAMEDSLGEPLPEMGEYYRDTQRIAMSYIGQLSQDLTGERVRGIQGMRNDLLAALERGGISPRALEPLAQPQKNAQLPPGWEQPSLFSQESLEVAGGGSDALDGGEETPIPVDLAKGTTDSTRGERDPLDGTITAETLGPLSYNSPSLRNDNDAVSKESTAVDAETGDGAGAGRNNPGPSQ